jgi:protein-L-isoaspartate(D-aspartate) O-methyltransferase
MGQSSPTNCDENGQRIVNQADHLVRQLRDQGISDERVLTAIRETPRQRFVPAELAANAWDNHALPIGHSQTISQPYVVAAMTESLGLTGREHVLEVGTGSGYQAAILCKLAGKVVTIERLESLAMRAKAILTELGCDNVTVVVGDGSQGWSAEAPYDSIIVTAGAPEIPPSLLQQLEPEGGRLVIPVGAEGNQHLVLIERKGDRLRQSGIGPVAFVPLIGSEGWPSLEGNDPSTKERGG